MIEHTNPSAGPAASDAPRELTAWERGLLSLILESEHPGSGELAQQIASVCAVSGCDCGCGSIDFVPDTETPRTLVPRGPVPVSATARTEDGQTIEALLFIDDEGRLGWLEYLWYADDPAREVRGPFPPLGA